MPYNFYTLDHTGAITGPTMYVACISDQIALSKAKNMVGDHVSIEVWDGPRLVGRVERRSY